MMETVEREATTCKVLNSIAYLKHMKYVTLFGKIGYLEYSNNSKPIQKKCDVNSLAYLKCRWYPLFGQCLEVAGHKTVARIKDILRTRLLHMPG
jgi:hypothetical protein